MPIYKNYNLVFVHIPKTAGTSVERVLGNGVFLSDRKDHQKGVCPQHYYLSQILELYPEAKSYHKFTIVRHPLDRLVSAYYQAIKSFWAKGLSFNEFVVKALNLDYKTRRFVLDGHVDCQSDYLDLSLPMNIFRYERLHVLVDYLSDKTKRKINLPHLNKSDHKLDFMTYYQDSSILNLAVDFYKKDFELFNYSLSFSSSTK